MSTGSLSIQPFEGSRCGIFELWILNPVGDTEGWKAGNFIASGFRNREWGRAFALTHNRTAGILDTRMATMFGLVLKS